MSDNPYHPPNEIDSSVSREFSIEQVSLTPLVKAAAFVTAGLGLLCLFAGAQLFVVVRVYGPLAFVPYVFLAFFPTGVFVGRQLFRMKQAGALAGLVFGVITALFTSAWIVYSLGHGLLLPLHALVPLLSVGTAILCGLSLAPTRTAEDARVHFAKEDLDIRF